MEETELKGLSASVGNSGGGGGSRPSQQTELVKD